MKCLNINFVKYHDSEQRAVFGFICGLSIVMYCKANIKVTSMNEYTDFVTISLYIVLFRAKDKHKDCGQLQVTVLERSYVATKHNCCRYSVIFHIIKSRSFPDKSTERSTLLCSFVLFQMFSDILRSTNPETGLLKLKTQQV